MNSLAEKANTEIRSVDWALGSNQSPAFGAAMSVPAILVAACFWGGGTDTPRDAARTRHVQPAQNRTEYSSSSSVSGFDWVVGSQETKQVGAPWHALTERVIELSKRETGWKGPNSLAAIAKSRTDIMDLIRKMSLEEIEAVPKVGLDYEGTFSLFWNEEDLKAELTAHGDGTYSFFAKKEGHVAFSDEEPVHSVLCPKLKNFLIG
ncbi:MAG: hypothetical protein ABJM82_04485 [Shimia thalassica]|uniref:hypothetical protein n=1 Tax=Shimia thalassica TaxID=1715693 RepID=UPI003296CF6C